LASGKKVVLLYTNYYFREPCYPDKPIYLRHPMRVRRVSLKPKIEQTPKQWITQPIVFHSSIQQNHGSKTTLLLRRTPKPPSLSQTQTHRFHRNLMTRGLFGNHYHFFSKKVNNKFFYVLYNINYFLTILFFIFYITLITFYYY
jgi:hypothetical protein